MCVCVRLFQKKRNTKKGSWSNQLLSPTAKKKKEDVKREFNIDLEDNYSNKKYSIVILAVAHDNFKNIEIIIYI